MENWMEDALQHEKFVQRVQASDDLKARLRSIPVQLGQKVYYVPKRALWATAAAIALLITVNFVSVTKYRGTEQNSGESAQSTSYFSYLESI